MYITLYIQFFNHLFVDIFFCISFLYFSITVFLLPSFSLSPLFSSSCLAFRLCHFQFFLPTLDSFSLQTLSYLPLQRLSSFICPLRSTKSPSFIFMCHRVMPKKVSNNIWDEKRQYILVSRFFTFQIIFGHENTFYLENKK